MNGRILRWTLPAVAGLLAGCTAMRSLPPALQEVPPGTEVRLTRKIQVPGGETRVYFQGGVRQGVSDIDKFRPSCYLEVRERKPRLRAVGPGTYKVQGGNAFETPFSDDQSEYQSWLDLARGPVRRLVCEQIADTIEWQPYVTPNQLEQAMGTAVRLDRPSG